MRELIAVDGVLVFTADTSLGEQVRLALSCTPLATTTASGEPQVKRLLASSSSNWRVLVIDLRCGSPELVHTLLRRRPDVAVVLVASGLGARDTSAAWRCGVADVLHLPLARSELREAVERAVENSERLPRVTRQFAAEHVSKKTTEILRCRFQGASNRDIAVRLGLSVAAVKARLRNEVFGPLDADGLVEVELAATRWYRARSEGL